MYGVPRYPKGEVLTFKTTGQKRNFTLVPFHRLFGERYAVYWRVYGEGSPEHKEHLKQLKLEKERAARTGRPD